MRIYDYLEINKGNEEIIYSQINEVQNYNYSYRDLYNLVNLFIDDFQNNFNLHGEGILYINNDVISVAMIIAALTIGVTPILVTRGSQQSTFNCPHDFVIEYDYKINMIDSVIQENNKLINNKNTNISYNGKLGVFTSGSLGVPKLIYFDENTLINEFIKMNKRTNSKINIYVPTSLSSISGITNNILSPIIYGNTSFLKKEFRDEFRDKSRINSYYKDIINNEINSIFLTRNNIEAFPDYLKYKTSFNSLSEILLSGEMVNENSVSYIRNSFLDLKPNIIKNVYATTEAMGIISYCDELNMNVISLDVNELINNRFVFSTDKENVYMLKNKKEYIIDRKYDDKKFISFVPSSINMDGLFIDTSEFTDSFASNIGEIYYRKNDNWIKSGDIGFSYNNQLYIVDRKDNIIKIDNKTLCLSFIEKTVKKIIDNTVVAIGTNNCKKPFSLVVAVDHDANKTLDKLELKLLEIMQVYKENFGFDDLNIYITNYNQIQLSKSSNKLIRNNVFNTVDNYYRFSNVLMNTIRASELINKNYSYEQPALELNKCIRYKNYSNYQVENNIIKYYDVEKPYDLAKELILYKYVSDTIVDVRTGYVEAVLNKDILVAGLDIYLKSEIDDIYTLVNSDIKKEDYERIKYKKLQLENTKPIGIRKVYEEVLIDKKIKYKFLYIEPSYDTKKMEFISDDLGKVCKLSVLYKTIDNMSEEEFNKLYVIEYNRPKDTVGKIESFNLSKKPIRNLRILPKINNYDETLKRYREYFDGENSEELIECFEKLYTTNSNLLVTHNNALFLEEMFKEGKRGKVFNMIINFYEDESFFHNIMDGEYDEILKNIIHSSLDEYGIILVINVKNLDNSIQEKLVKFMDYLKNDKKRFSLNNHRVVSINTINVKVCIAYKGDYNEIKNEINEEFNNKVIQFHLKDNYKFTDQFFKDRINAEYRDFGLNEEYKNKLFILVKHKYLEIKETGVENVLATIIGYINSFIFSNEVQNIFYSKLNLEEENKFVVKKVSKMIDNDLDDIKALVKKKV